MKLAAPDFEFAAVTAKEAYAEAYDPDQAYESYVATVEEKGGRVVLPGQQELQIDLDSAEAWETFLARWQGFMEPNYPAAGYVAAPSRSGLPKRHVTVTMPFPVTEAERIAWQAALGSDWLRELLSLRRLNNGWEHPTLFAEGGVK